MKKLFLLILIAVAMQTHAQNRTGSYYNYTRYDSLRGGNSILKSAYDLNYYHLDVYIDPRNQSITGSNLFRFRVVNDLQRLQFDLYPYLQIKEIAYHGKPLSFERELNAVYVQFPERLTKGSLDSFTVYYSSERTDSAGLFARVRAFSYKPDSNGKPWLTTSCQGSGGSTWWPCKEDGGADEVDSMMISVTVPKGFVDVSNGRLAKKTKQKNGDVRYDWYLKSPVNNYCVAANVGDYVMIPDSYNGEKGKLDIEYWVLRENEQKARNYFPDQTKKMLQAFEYWFGPYPFYEDSYKLVDANYVGMEHQSAVAYGNDYKFGYSRWKQPDISKTGHGEKFDYIIIHESGHEWFGNSISAKDVADWWIHESFTTYSEALYIDYHFGKQASHEYVHGQRREIANDMPVQGPYGVNRSGSRDKYFKGAVFLNMLRSIIDNDEKWRHMLRGMNQHFYHQTTDYDEVVAYLTRESGMNLKPIFDQYFKTASIPVLELMEDEGKIFARWLSETPGFEMPVHVKLPSETVVIHATTRWKAIDVPARSIHEIEPDTFNYYIGVLKQ